MRWVNTKKELPAQTGRYLTFSWGQYGSMRTFLLLFYRKKTEELDEDECGWRGHDRGFQPEYWLDGDIETPLAEKWEEERKESRNGLLSGQIDKEEEIE